MNINTIIYLTEASVLTSIFYLFYRYLYFKLAYFVWSRYYLYAVLFFSLSIPLFPGIFNYQTVNTNIVQILNLTNSGNINGFVNINNSFINGNNPVINLSVSVKILLILWISGVIRFLFILTKQIFSVIRLIKTGQKSFDGKYTIVKSNFKGSVFSFFKYIFINEQFNRLTESEQNQIIRHEKIHATQYHSLDNLIFEIHRAFFWFNPVSKLIAADIKIIHEFIVDNLITENKNKPDYSKLILKLSSKPGEYTAVSNFSKEEIKNRIKLISFPEKEKIRKRRFIISVPVLIFTLLASWLIVSSTNSYIKNTNINKKPYHKPFDKNTYKIISPYFENRKIDGLTVSHKEVSCEVKSFSNIYAIETGITTHINTKNIFGLKEITLTEKLNTGYTVIYSGIYQVFTQVGDSIKKGEKIGKTGDIRLYPAVNIKITKNGKTYNPENFY